MTTIEEVIDKIQEKNPWILPDEAEKIAREFLRLQEEYNLYFPNQPK